MKKAFLTLAVLCCIGLMASCQIRNTNELEIDSIQMDDDTNAGELIDPIQIDPQFPGGVDSMYAFIARNFRLPQKCDGVKGTIWVRFVIERDGTVSNAEVMRGLGNEYDEEALRVVRMMPRWIPCRFAGSETPTRSHYIVPIKFNLE
ncbi:MAG: TonB family protein [Bacteroidales bacterium]|nr:TonB family protein [Bacteroidales bacterium]